ncbi:MAG: TetR/AcrR family transcriptional regulator [Chitinophaga sp.]|uniref:TetR/AcrR family transcriptional regulator n=1 Tax=Chitinophaga sp. TaxID=1869181 RepID=UPI0025C0713E|nr:TetR/AcrR family transcriptional regulator [Chitinophaga sp.]MBV8251679.1 TetR/AcrR family transcriptional regulator [Chitinophaga sp.]
MGSKERIAREKAQVRKDILDAALEIIIEEGCLALSMRKIADRIEYAVASIYEYFANKDTILAELTGQGYTLLSEGLRKAAARQKTPYAKLEAMWLAYWQFAFKHGELYKLMYGIQTSCPKPEAAILNATLPQQLFQEAIAVVLHAKDPEHKTVRDTYFSLWAMVHGLAAINITNDQLSKEMNLRILKNAIGAIVRNQVS